MIFKAILFKTVKWSLIKILGTQVFVGDFV